MGDRIAGVVIREYVISDYPFREDYTYISPSFDYQPIAWRFHEVCGVRKGLEVEQNGHTFIANAKRRADWGWILSAAYGPGRVEWTSLANTTNSEDNCAAPLVHERPDFVL